MEIQVDNQKIVSLFKSGCEKELQTVNVTGVIAETFY